MSLSYQWNNDDSLHKHRFLCLPKPARSFSLLDIHAKGLTLPSRAAVTAIAAALPSQPQEESATKKAQDFHFVPYVLFCG
jgi:hypothetical protein